MDMKQAMVERHMVRKYTDKPIPTEIVRRINGRVSDVNAEYRTDIELVSDEVIGIIAVGYGATQGKPHKSKSAQEVATYEGPEPEWFKNGVEAALLAPTALGKQAFKIEGAGDEVSITYEPGAFAGEDLGLVKYHFALGVGSHSFCWKAAR